MSFFGKFKPGAANSASATSTSKKDSAAPPPSALEKYLADVTEPIRPDGSDKFFGFENYGSTCYCNSIIQCLYYSAPFRDNVLHFPSKEFLEAVKDNRTHGDSTTEHTTDGAPLSPKPTAHASTPYPNPTSPARKPLTQSATFTGTTAKPDDNKDTPDYKKKLAIQAGPVLDMTRDLSRNYGMDESLFTSLKDIFEAVTAHKSRTGVVSPHKFLEILRRENEMFRSAMHQDAHEFLNLLLNSVVEDVEQFARNNKITNGLQQDHSLEKALSRVPAPATGLDSRWVHDIFEGLLTSETRCLTCETVSQRDEAFLDLSVDLSPHTSVTSCLRKFSQEEMLCERNKFHCDTCGGLQEAEKRMKIKRLPKILALHLKRFKYTEDLQRLQKLFHRVVYPYHLRLFNTTDDAEDADRLYELYAVVVHIGGGPYHGHYVSIVKTQDRGWLLFDDELVEPVDKKYVLNFFGGEPVPGSQDARQLACAYVLFYQETTLEAVLKEQELEAQSEGVSTATPQNIAKQIPRVDAATLLDIATPVAEEPNGMESLAHAATAPPLLNSHVVDSDTHRPGIMSFMSKRDVKQDEKDRKAIQKAEEKARDALIKEASQQRVDAMRQQQEDLKQAVEASKHSAAEESRARSDDVTPEKHGFSRFTRTGSLNLRGRSRLFGGKDRDKEQAPQPPPPIPPIQTSLQGAVNDEPVLTALPQAPLTSPAVEDLMREHKEKKNRFSMGRKRSTQVL